LTSVARELTIRVSTQCKAMAAKPSTPVPKFYQKVLTSLWHYTRNKAILWA